MALSESRFDNSLGFWSGWQRYALALGALPRQQEQAWQGVQSHDIEAFADPLLSSPALLVPHPIELDPRMQDLQLLDPQMDPRLGLPGPGMPGL